MPTPDPHETIPPGEDRAVAEALALLDALQRTDPGRRSQHAKAHGLLAAEFRVRADVPDPLRHGLFARPAVYPAWVRVSNSFAQDDREPDFRGMAVKLCGVPGRTLADDEPVSGTVDFLTADTPVFFAPDPGTLYAYFARRGSLEAGGVSAAEVAARLAAEFPAVVAVFARYAAPGGCPFSASYFSTVAYRLGPHAVKYRLRATTPEPQPRPQADTPDGVRELMTRRLTDRGESAAFAFEVQLREDPAAMPVEDGTAAWDSPFTAVADLVIPAQAFATPDRDALGENLSFNPWRTLPEHRPLGGLNRARGLAYPAGSKLRHDTRGVPAAEPPPPR